MTLVLFRKYKTNLSCRGQILCNPSCAPRKQRMPVYVVKISKYHLSSSRLTSSQYTHIYPIILLLLVLLIYHFSIKNRFASRDVQPHKNLDFIFLPVLQFWMILYVLYFLVLKKKKSIYQHEFCKALENRWKLKDIHISLALHWWELHYYCLLPWYLSFSLSLMPHPPTINRIISQIVRKSRVEARVKKSLQRTLEGYEEESISRVPHTLNYFLALLHDT